MAEKPNSHTHLWGLFIGLCLLGIPVYRHLSPAPPASAQWVSVKIPPLPQSVFGAKPEFKGRVYAEDYLRAALKNFDRMRNLEAQEPAPCTLGRGTKSLSGYLVSFTFNFTTRSGAYTATRRGSILVKNERIIWASSIE